MARAGAVVAGLAFVGVTAAAFVWGPDLYDTLAADDPRGPEGCVVTVDGSGSYALSLDAADNAALIAGVGFQRGYGVNGITVALATAIQESGLRNLDYGDRDSLGLFQQRPSQGWGTVEQITDPYYASNTFYAALERVDGWESMRVTDAAQAVQRSGFPEAYEDHAAEARAWARALTGDAGATVACTIDPPEPHLAQDFAARLLADLGPSFTVDVRGYDGDETLLGVRPLDASPAALAALRSWLILTASDTGAVWVEDASTRWERTGDTGTPDGAADGYAGVVLAITTS